MANVKISQLTAGSALTGAEEIPVVQGSSTVKTTAQDIADLASGGGPVMPTFSFVTTNNINPGYYFDNYLINSNINGVVLSGYTKTGALTINSSNYNSITSFTSDVEILQNFQTNFANLTTLSLPNLVAIQNQFNPGSPLITDLGASLPSLQRVGSGFSINSSLNILNLNFPNITYLGSLTLNNNNPSVVTSINFSNLVSVGQAINISNQTAVTTFNFNSLATAFAQISISSLTSLTNIAFVNLTTLNNNNNATALSVQSCTALFSFIMPSIVRIYSSGGNTINFSSGTPNLTVFGFGSGLKQIGGTSGNVIFTSCSLSQSSVDGILVSLAALDGTNGTTSFNNRTVTITGTSATPSATGLAAKAVLQGRGCTVTNN
jgi:hypothetical protein